MQDRTCSEEGCERRLYALGLCQLHWRRQHNHGTTADPRPTIMDRFRAKVAVTDGCWEWTGARLPPWGYGQFGVDGRTVYAHRFSYETFVGEIPPGLFVCHRCDNPCCVRPDHLFVGTQSDNMRDCTTKGRLRGGVAAWNPCGTMAAYMGHRRHGEEPCKECRLAARAYWQLQYDKRRVRPRVVA